MRGGTSKGTFFHALDLPTEDDLRNRVLSAVMGAGDPLQIDGMGGGHPLSSKVAVVALSETDRTEVEYLFLQVNPQTGEVDTTQNCGNMLVAVGPFAIEQGLVPVTGDETRLRVRMLNSGNLCELTVPTPGGQVRYEGETSIDGVPGTAAAILCNYLDVAGSATGAMLPTGNVLDRIDGVDVTLVDNGMPVVIVAAAALGIRGDEAPAQLETNHDLVARKESIRLQAGKLMGLGDVTAKTVPKVSVVSRPRAGGHLATRTFIPHACHKAIGVLGAASVATACLLEGSVAHALATEPEHGTAGISDVVIEHPSGSLHLRLQVRRDDGELQFDGVGVLRTARMLFRGETFVPASVWSGHGVARETQLRQGSSLA